jgi:hypothetical protein
MLISFCVAAVFGFGRGQVPTTSHPEGKCSQSSDTNKSVLKNHRESHRCNRSLEERDLHTRQENVCGIQIELLPDGDAK